MGNVSPFIPSHEVGGGMKDRISRKAGWENYRGISHFVGRESREMESRKMGGDIVDEVSCKTEEENRRLHLTLSHS